MGCLKCLHAQTCKDANSEMAQYCNNYATVDWSDLEKVLNEVENKYNTPEDRNGIMTKQETIDIYDKAVYMAINALSTKPKKGKWVQVHGYATPGGDPVWACSECGKGAHVYGIEHGTYGSDIADGQWVACPNCGVKMEG